MVCAVEDGVRQLPLCMSWHAASRHVTVSVWDCGLWAYW
jgi:hypothetical protein